MEPDLRAGVCAGDLDAFGMLFDKYARGGVQPGLPADGELVCRRGNGLAHVLGSLVIKDATDAIGSHGVAMAMTYQGVRTEWIFNRQPLQYLGERHANVANGSSAGVSALLQRAFVGHAGQVPR